jgi:hypothetical protein
MSITTNFFIKKRNNPTGYYYYYYYDYDYYVWIMGL